MLTTSDTLTGQTLKVGYAPWHDITTESSNAVAPPGPETAANTTVTASGGTYTIDAGKLAELQAGGTRHVEANRWTVNVNGTELQQVVVTVVDPAERIAWQLALSCSARCLNDDRVGDIVNTWELYR